MTPLLDGFADELVKCARRDDWDDKSKLHDLYTKVKRRQGNVRGGRMSKLRGSGHPVSRDYLASMMLVAMARPLLTLTSGKISRALHNRQIMKAIRSAAKPKDVRKLKRELQSLKSIGHVRPGMRVQDRPIMTPASLAGDMASGALYGSVIQMLRDRYSGSKGVRH